MFYFHNHKTSIKTSIKYFFIQKHYSRGVWTPKNEINIYIYIYTYIHMLQHLILHMFDAFVTQTAEFVCICCGICLHLLWHLFAFVVTFVCIVVGFLCICCGICFCLFFNVLHICLRMYWHKP